MFEISTLNNGLCLILERLDHVESVAFDLYMPGGLAVDADDKIGGSLILPELTSRGAAGLDARQISNLYESKGIRHSEYTAKENFIYRGVCLGENIAEALRLTSLMIKRPDFPDDGIDNIKNGLYQEIRSLEDSPARKVGTELTARYFPAPYNRSGVGEKEGIATSDKAYLKQLCADSYKPEGSVLSVAGNFDPELIHSQIEEYFNDWTGKAMDRVPYSEFPVPYADHVSSESQQLQIMLACKAPDFSDKHYYAAKLASGILSGGMFGRLFIEVREKRGLCYSVYCRHAANMNYGMLSAYAGTTTDRADETLEVMLEVLGGIPGTVKEDELERARANLLSSIIMSEESTSSRSASNATDWWISGKVRQLDDIRAGIEAVSLKDIDECMERFPIKDFMLVTLGARELNYKSGEK